MKENFQETIGQKTNEELEMISKDYAFYSEEERLIALNELENRNCLTQELSDYKKEVEDFKKQEDELKIPSHKITFKDLIPQKNYLFTPILIYINVFVFILMALLGVSLFNPQIEDLIQWGGNIRYLTMNGQIWRLFTSIFLHAGIFHLVFNMYALLYVGSILEKTIGKSKFIFSYLVSGIVASVSSLIIHENIVSVGASGAIFGVYGVLLALLIFKNFKTIEVSTKSLLSNASIFVLYNIFYGFSKSGIDNAAHIGGLLSGFIIGTVYCFIVKEKIKQIPAYISLIIIFFAFSFLAIMNVSDIYGEYDRTMKQVAINEQKALWMYRENISAMPKSKLKERLTNEGVNLWSENIALLNKIKCNNYNEPLPKQIEIFMEYSSLRKKSCELMRESLENNSFEIIQSIKEINIQMESKIMELEEINKTANARNLCDQLFQVVNIVCGF